MRPDPKSAKKTVKLSSFIMLLGSSCVKAACRMLVKLTPGKQEPIGMLIYNLRDKNKVIWLLIKQSFMFSMSFCLESVLTSRGLQAIIDLCCGFESQCHQKLDCY